MVWWAHGGMSNFLGICNKLKPNPLSKSSIVLRIAGTLIFCWSVIILTVIVMTSKDYESSRVTKTLTLAPPWIYSQFWTHFEDRERISEVELVTGYSGMSSVYIYTGLNMPRQGTLQSGRSCCDIIICVARLSLWKFNCQLSDTFCGRLHVGHVWLTECSDLWHVSLVWRMQMQPLQQLCVPGYRVGGQDRSCPLGGLVDVLQTKIEIEEDFVLKTESSDLSEFIDQCSREDVKSEDETLQEQFKYIKAVF